MGKGVKTLEELIADVPQFQIDEFERLWEEDDAFSGMEIPMIVHELKYGVKYQWSNEKVANFGRWFVHKALIEGWLLDDLGFT